MTATELILGTITVQSPGFGWLESLALAAGIVAVVFAYTAGLRYRQHAPPARFGLLTLRLGAIVCAFMALWHPACQREETFALRPTLAIVLDDSSSMSQPAEGASQADREPVSRFDRAVAVLDARLRPVLNESHELRLFDAEARALDFDRLPATSEGPRSPLTDTLVRVQQDLRDRPLAGIVLLSDGRDVSDRPPTGTLEQLRVPVHAVEIAGDLAASGPPNLILQGVSTNRRALVGNTVRVGVDITAVGAAEVPASGRGHTVPVAILDGGETVARATIKWPADRTAVRVELDFTPRRAGEFTYAVQVGALPGETDLADNRQTFPLTVRAKPLTVVYVDGVLRWEGKFLREALATDPDINTVSTVRTAPPGADRGSQGLLLAEQLANVDVVMLGDVEAAFFSTSEISALRSWVTDSGGALVLTGGYRSFGSEGFGATVLRDILPIEFSADPNPQSEQPFGLKLTAAGREHPIFNLTGDGVRDAAFFHALPPLAGCSRIAGVKASAQVLAVNPQITAPDGSRGLPVLVTQEVGAGRTMVFAVDTTWRWRMVVGGFTGDSSFYPQFWGQLVRWMATDEEETPPRLIVSTDRYRYKVGQTIEVNIELASGAADASDASVAAGTEPGRHIPHGGRYRVTAAALTESGDRASIPLAELDAASFRGTLAARSPGRLDLLVRAESLDRPEAGVTTFGEDEVQELSAVATVQVERPDLEALDPRPDPQWLAQVAQLSGGRCVRLDQIETWAAGLPADPVPATRLRTSGAAGDRILAAVFLALLCAEWILRRRSRLA